MAFWDSWENITPFEQKRIDAVKEFITLIESTLCDKIYCVLIGGSFPRREYREDSDVDMWVIVHKDEDIIPTDKKVRELIQSGIKEILVHAPSIRSLEALERGSDTIKVKEQMGPKRFVLTTHNHEVIFGKPLPYTQLPSQDPKKALISLLEFALSEPEKWNDETLAKFLLHIKHFERLHLGSTDKFSLHKLKSIDGLTATCASFILGTAPLPDGTRKEIIEHLTHILDTYTNPA